MLTLPPARLEAVAQLCIQEFRQFPPTQLVIVTFNRDGQLIGTTRLLQPFDRYSTEQLLRYMVQAQAASALVADLSPWPLWSADPSLQRLHEVGNVSDLLFVAHYCYPKEEVIMIKNLIHDFRTHSLP